MADRNVRGRSQRRREVLKEPGRKQFRVRWRGLLRRGRILKSSLMDLTVALLDRRKRRSRSYASPPAWVGRSRALRYGRWVALAVGIVLLLFLARAVWVVFFRGTPWNFIADPDDGCRRIGFSCGVVSGIGFTVLPLAVASAFFLIWRLRKIRRPYVGRAKENPTNFVETAGEIIDEVVGRNHLCSVLMDDLLDHENRRPHVVLGGVGLGKTAVLVQLTKQLAEQGAVPVPVRLRDARDELNFRTLANLRFKREAQQYLLSDGESDRVWRQLIRDDRVVVLADGLEEALVDGPHAQERDSMIRLAVRLAGRQRLPLVIASRQHDAVAGLDAAVVPLEPLSQEAALEYIQKDVKSDDAQRLDWIVERAEVVETPLYLQLARQLQQAGQLRYVQRDDLDTRGPIDRIGLRRRLMDAWTRAVNRGHLFAEVPLERRDRQATVAQMGALACMGLRDDKIEVKFEDYETEEGAGNDVPGRAGLEGVLTEQIEDAGAERVSMRLAATRAMRLRLVEMRGEAVRFPHSILQAYLGARVLTGALNDPEYRREALKKPGREYLIALIMFSRSADADEMAPRSAHGDLLPSRLEWHWRHLISHELLEAGKKEKDARALDLFAAAFEVDSGRARSPSAQHPEMHEKIAEELAKSWSDRMTESGRTAEEAKLKVITRFGEAARTIVLADKFEAYTTNPHLPPESPVAHRAYKHLYEIACKEELYPIRLAAAQELAAGGDEAFLALRDRLAPPGQKPVDEDRADEVERSRVLSAWLVPMLAGSIEPPEPREGPRVLGQADAESQAARPKQKQALDLLDDWVERVGDDPSRDMPRLALQHEVALAQGFKHALNRRRRHPHTYALAHDHLAEKARGMLRRTTFWFSRLTLLHALCLWALPDEPAPEEQHTFDVPRRRRVTGRRRRVPEPPPVVATGRSDQGSRPAAIVNHWLARSDGGREHPFVLAAGKLVIRALSEKEPEKYIWIDESGVVTKIGSLPDRKRQNPRQNLWIAPSAGWAALDSKAQQLVADVLILLNLAERGETVKQRAERFARCDSDRLPPCMTEDRSYLNPDLTVGTAKRSGPGSNCKDGCPFELCPYPPKGEKNYRVELSEAFCRRQAILLLPTTRTRRAEWQRKTPRPDLRRFWDEMESRARR